MGGSSCWTAGPSSSTWQAETCGSGPWKSGISGGTRAADALRLTASTLTGQLLGNDKAWKWRNACHLIAKQLGGSGLDRENLATCSRTANSSRMDTSTPEHRHSNMAKWEQDVHDAVQADQVVHYTVTPVYNGPHIVPVAFRMRADGHDPAGGKGIHFDKLVMNEMCSKYDKKWHNMGEWSPTDWVE
ncbi:DNA/RNA non-specific endonuclease [Streptomyces xanthophaeus]